MADQPVVSWEQEEAMHRAQEVSRMMANPLFQEVFEDIRTANIEAWRALGTTLEDREYHWLLDRCIGAVEGALRSVVDNGIKANKDIERLLKRHPELDPTPEGD